MAKIIKIINDINIFDPKFERVDIFLTNQLKEHSRSYLKKIIEEGNLTVNGKIVIKSSYCLKLNDELVLNLPPVEQYDLSPHKVDFEIIDVQEDFIVINKPAGLIVHPADNCKDKLTLVHGLLYYFKELLEFDEAQRPGIVHRIDKDTSGLMIVARNLIGQAKLVKLFKDRLIKKTYLAVALGHPDKSGKIDFSIGRNPVHPTQMSHRGINSREALTYYQVIKYFKESSLVEVRIITGRTHQIRVHFAAIGHGLIGDKTYGCSSKFIGRQALHSWKIEFSLDGVDYQYEAPIADDILNLISKLENK